MCRIEIRIWEINGFPQETVTDRHIERIPALEMTDSTPSGCHRIEKPCTGVLGIP